MKELLLRLTSRTFWVAVLSIGTFIVNEQYTEAASVAVAYILGEKAIDTASTVRGTKVGNISNSTINVSPESPDDVDKSEIVTGAHRIPPFDEKVKE